MLWMLWEFQSRNGIPIRWLSKDELYGADDGAKDEFDIVLDNDMRKELNIMCNLSEGIAEEAREEALAEAWAEANKLSAGIAKETRNETIIKMAVGMLRENVPAKTISRVTNLSEEKILELGASHNLV